MSIDGEVAAYMQRLPVGVFRSTREGKLVMANSAVARLLGFESVHEVIGARTTDFYVDPNDRSREIRRADSGEELGVMELWLKRRDGTPFLARVHSRGIPGPDGRTEFLEGVIEDITEAHEVRERLALSETLFRTAFERSPFPMILLNSDLEPVAANAATIELLQISEEEFLSLPTPSLMSPDSWEEAMENVDKLRRGERDSYSGTRRLELPNGETKWVIVSVSAAREPDGSLHSLINQMADITDQRRVQDQLEGLVRSKDDLVRSVSHELRTPLTSIVGLADELATDWDRFDERERRELIDLVAEQSRDMAELVNDLLAAARAEVGMLSIEPCPLDLRREAEAIVKTWGERTVIKLVEPGVPVDCHADPYRVRQILRNLISNAVKYGVAPIVVEACESGDMAEVSVRDMGDALPEWQRETIFDPYFRLARTEGPPGSVGLGLSVSRNLARLMGGDLSYRVTEGRSDFVLSLPRDGSSQVS